MVALGKLNILDSITRRSHQFTANTAVNILLLRCIPDPPGSILRFRRLAAVLLSGKGAGGGIDGTVSRVITGRLRSILSILRSSLCRFRSCLRGLSSRGSGFSIILRYLSRSLGHQRGIGRGFGAVPTNRSHISGSFCRCFSCFRSRFVCRSLSTECFDLRFDSFYSRFSVLGFRSTLSSSGCRVGCIGSFLCCHSL